jgi:hypothetical protein
MLRNEGPYLGAEGLHFGTHSVFHVAVFLFDVTS